MHTVLQMEAYRRARVLKPTAMIETIAVIFRSRLSRLEAGEACKPEGRGRRTRSCRMWGVLRWQYIF